MCYKILGDIFHRNEEFYRRKLIMVNVLKFWTLLFLFLNKMFIIKAGIHKMHVKVGNLEDPDQTASAEAV